MFPHTALQSGGEHRAGPQNVILAGERIFIGLMTSDGNDQRGFAGRGDGAHVVVAALEALVRLFLYIKLTSSLPLPQTHMVG